MLSTFFLAALLGRIAHVKFLLTSITKITNLKKCYVTLSMSLLRHTCRKPHMTLKIVPKAACDSGSCSESRV